MGRGGERDQRSWNATMGMAALGRGGRTGVVGGKIFFVFPYIFRGGWGRMGAHNKNVGWWKYVVEALLYFVEYLFP